MSDGDDLLSVWHKGNAIIRQAFHINPESLPEQEWAKLYNEALYLKKLDAEVLERSINKALGG